MEYDDALRTLHPIARGAFAQFFDAITGRNDLSHVRPFEAHRNPEAQELVRAAGASKVGAWRSVHQYGCAVDLVPRPGGKWTWQWDGWSELHRLGERFGIVAPIEWDKPHHVLRHWNYDLRKWLSEQKFT